MDLKRGMSASGLDAGIHFIIKGKAPAYCKLMSNIGSALGVGLQVLGLVSQESHDYGQSFILIMRLTLLIQGGPSTESEQHG